MQQSPDPELLAKRILFLRETAFFGGLIDEDLKELAGKFKSRRYKRKEVIFHQGDASNSLYVIRKGKVRIFCVIPNGSETSIRIYSPGDIIGEFSAIDGQQRSTTAQAINDCTLLELSAAVLKQFIREKPEFVNELLLYLVAKLRWTTTYAETIAQYDIETRLLILLMQYKESMGKKIEHGTSYEIDLSTNQEDLASMVGARREWVNRLFRKWSKEDLIRYNQGKITILDFAKFKEMLDERLDLYFDDEDE